MRRTILEAILELPWQEAIGRDLWSRNLESIPDKAANFQLPSSDLPLDDDNPTLV